MLGIYNARIYNDWAYNTQIYNAKVINDRLIIFGVDIANTVPTLFVKLLPSPL